MFETVSGLIRQYQAKFIKFDFNQDLKLDIYQKGYLDYFKGYEKFIKRLRSAHPDLYMENCASGGARMSLENGFDFDSFWLSDNQSPYEGVRIVRDTLLRMPPQMIERWATLQSVCDFKHCYMENSNEKLIATNDATWTDVRGVHQSYLQGFLTGGPIGFSCDLNSLSETAVADLKEFIAIIKQDREFWKQAECRILADTESVLVLEYSDCAFERAEVVVYTDRIRQNGLTVYPTINIEKEYMVNDETLISGIQIEKEGIHIELDGNYRAKRLSFKSMSKK